MLKYKVCFFLLCKTFFLKRNVYTFLCSIFYFDEQCLFSRAGADVNSMQPSRVTDFGALAQSAGFRIEDLANLNASMFSVPNQIC
jgi:hypothetical protein